MTRFATFPIAAWLAVTIPALPRSGPADARPVIVQGAMQLEIEKLAGRLDNSRVERVGGWTFWTVIGVEHYHPGAIVNQGTAGGHDPSLHLYDIVVGASPVNIGAFKSRYRGAGAGSSPFDWMPLDPRLLGDRHVKRILPNYREAQLFVDVVTTR
jgi:adenosylhomocysteine nucleosidase